MWEVPTGLDSGDPGERITREAPDYLTTGVKAGMLVPEVAGPEFTSIRVVAAR